MERLKRVIKQAAPRAFKTIWWIFKITATVSFIMFLLKYTGILSWIAAAVSPVFRIFGLPGDASLAYVSGYFINVYSCIAVVSTIDLTARQITILGTMTLAAHAMVVETAVQKKTGAPALYTVLIRTLGSIALGIIMSQVLPGRPAYDATEVNLSEIPFFQIQGEFWPMFMVWFKGLAKLAVWMTVLITLLNVLQRAFYEYGIMDKNSHVGFENSEHIVGDGFADLLHRHIHRLPASAGAVGHYDTEFRGVFFNLMFQDQQGFLKRYVTTGRSVIYSESVTIQLGAQVKETYSGIPLLRQIH